MRCKFISALCGQAYPVMTSVVRRAFRGAGTVYWEFPAMDRRRLAPKKPRTENRFRFRELARAVRAARAAGGERVEVDPLTGKISVVIKPPDEQAAGDGKSSSVSAEAAKEWDEATAELLKSKSRSAPTRRL